MIKNYYILDCSNLLYRSFYGIKPMYTSSGIPVNALYGFCKTLLKIIKEQPVDHLIAACDGKSTHRKLLWAEYKAHRSETPDELKIQKKLLEIFLKEAEITVYHDLEYEADDLIAGFVEEYSKNPHNNITIVSSDKDFHQLLRPSVCMYNPATHSIIEEKDLSSIYHTQCTRDKILLYYSLCGDSSDNVPGVRAIGKKTAEDIISRYSSLDDLYENYTNDPLLKQSVKKALYEEKEKAYLSLSLVKPLDYCNFKPEPSLWRLKNKEKKIYDFFAEYEFFSLLPKSALPIKKEETLEELNKASEDFESKCASNQNIEELYKELLNSKIIALDTETNGGEKRKSTFVGFSVCTNKSHAWYVPYKHNNQENISEENIQKLLSLLSGKTLIMHNALFDLHILANHQMHCSGDVYDTMVAAHILYGEHQKLGLKELSKSVLKQSMSSFQEVLNAHNYKEFSEVPLEQATLYAAADARQTFMLWSIFEEKLHTEKSWDLFYSIEMPLLKILYTMEKNGIGIKKEILEEQSIIILKLMNELKKSIEEKMHYAPDTLNLQSSQQVGKLLFENLGLQPPKGSKNASGFSTDSNTLNELSHMHPIAAEIASYRTLASIKNRFTDNFFDYIKPEGRVYPSYNQTHVATGRLSSSDPNIQNIPLDPPSKEYSIRKAFIAKQGNSLFSFDYSQIELRILAYLSQDENLIETFKNDGDIHIATACKIYHIDRAEVTSQQRHFAKRINFGIIYGLTAFGLSKQLSITTTQAQAYLNEYKNAYPKAFLWMNEIKDSAKNQGYVTTYLGRKRYIQGLQDNNKTLFNEACRIAINTIIQGSAAEIVKKGMLETQKAISCYKNTSIILQIHDEIIIEGPEEETKNILIQVAHTLENIADWNVPLKVHASTGKNWSEIS